MKKKRINNLKEKEKEIKKELELDSEKRKEEEIERLQKEIDSLERQMEVRKKMIEANYEIWKVSGIPLYHYLIPCPDTPYFINRMYL